MTTPSHDPGSHRSAGDHEANSAASLEDRVDTALDTVDDLLDAMALLVNRVESLEQSGPSKGDSDGSDDTLNRSDYRFDRYPPVEDDKQRTANLYRAQRAWNRLDGWVQWLVATFRLHSVVPSCWPEHALVIEELTALLIAWHGAWRDEGAPDAPAAFIDRVERVRNRLSDNNWGSMGCKGSHDGSGIDLASHYHQWRNQPRQRQALTAARDRSFAAVANGGAGAQRRRSEQHPHTDAEQGHDRQPLLQTRGAGAHVEDIEPPSGGSYGPQSS